MKRDRSIIVHGLDDAVAALAEARSAGHAVTLLSAPGAALYAGCGWWRALVEAARSRHPDVSCTDILDCADATGHALAALRIGVTRLVLWPDAPGRAGCRVHCRNPWRIRFADATDRQRHAGAAPRVNAAGAARDTANRGRER